jgi:hypothetical protein
MAGLIAATPRERGAPGIVRITRGLLASAYDADEHAAVICRQGGEFYSCEETVEAGR